MKKETRLFLAIANRCKLDRLLIGFIILFMISAGIILKIEPNIGSYGDALWYLFVASTSIGFGDFVVTTVIGRLLTVVLLIYEVVLVAIFSGVVVGHYLEVIRKMESDSATLFVDNIRHLTDMSRDELEEIQERARKIRVKR